MELIGQIGFLPLLDSGIKGFSAEEILAHYYPGARLSTLY